MTSIIYCVKNVCAAYVCEPLWLSVHLKGKSASGQSDVSLRFKEETYGSSLSSADLNIEVLRFDVRSNVVAQTKENWEDPKKLLMLTMLEKLQKNL